MPKPEVQCKCTDCGKDFVHKPNPVSISDYVPERCRKCAEKTRERDIVMRGVLNQALHDAKITLHELERAPRDSMRYERDCRSVGLGTRVKEMKTIIRVLEEELEAL